MKLHKRIRSRNCALEPTSTRNNDAVRPGALQYAPPLQESFTLGTQQHQENFILEDNSLKITGVVVRCFSAIKGKDLHGRDSVRQPFILEFANNDFTNLIGICIFNDLVGSVAPGQKITAHIRTAIFIHPGSEAFSNRLTAFRITHHSNQ